VYRAVPVVEQHPEAGDRLPQRAVGEANLREVFGGEWDRDHGRVIFGQLYPQLVFRIILESHRNFSTFRENLN
jgi:hypothetical protein